MSDILIQSPGKHTLPILESLPSWLRADLRSDHAGETGAVYIYLGILRASNSNEVRDFAYAHLAKEREHLAFFEEWLEQRHTSMLLPVWRLFGWLLGACAGLGGPGAVYVTIDAVESFVVAHYREQVVRLDEANAWPEIRTVLQRFQNDEEAHRHDAELRYHPGRLPCWVRPWRVIVDVGSRLAVVAARRF